METKELTKEVKKLITKAGKQADQLTAMKKTTQAVERTLAAREKQLEGVIKLVGDLPEPAAATDPALAQAQQALNKQFSGAVSKLTEQMRQLEDKLQAIEDDPARLDPGMITQMREEITFCHGICKNLGHLTGRTLPDQ